ncbi:hypothetical protein [Streptacidiphilus carbonis]|uniref:hypothetical protein n=1 Tax=Streptacidiphilus carbonis TaxID=105422 RepID=UPI0005A8A402|nr:hypothetical protein [Streptacidiphilus carbonis]
MIATVDESTAVNNDPIEGAKTEIVVTDGSDGITLVGQIQSWLAEPGFPALTEILLSVQTGQGLAALTPAAVRALAPGLHRFADDLVVLADQVDALGGA